MTQSCLRHQSIPSNEHRGLQSFVSVLDTRQTADSASWGCALLRQTELQPQYNDTICLLVKMVA